MTHCTNIINIYILSDFHDFSSEDMVSNLSGSASTWAPKVSTALGYTTQVLESNGSWSLVKSDEFPHFTSSFLLYTQTYFRHEA